MGRKRRLRKRRLDLRDFWPWYERNPGGEIGAEPPPFALDDIRRDSPPIPGRKLLQILCIVVAVVVLATVVYGIFR